VKKLLLWILIAALTVGVLAAASYAIALRCAPSPVGAAPEVAAIWQNFWAVFNNLVLTATLLVVAYYTYETYRLRRAAVESNVLSYRPILVFDAAAPFCTVKNKGYGPALNIALLIWDGNTLKVSADSEVPGIMPPGNDSHRFNVHVEIDSAGFKKRLPEFASIIERVITTRHALFCLTYRDLAGNRFYSIINGSNETNYEGVFEHGVVAEA
jgi:hypothetical protein